MEKRDWTKKGIKCQEIKPLFMVKEGWQPQTDKEGPGAAFPKRCQQGKLILNLAEAAACQGPARPCGTTEKHGWVVKGVKAQVRMLVFSPDLHVTSHSSVTFCLLES